MSNKWRPLNYDKFSIREHFNDCIHECIGREPWHSSWDNMRGNINERLLELEMLLIMP
jgi:hypothetical protein